MGRVGREFDTVPIFANKFCEPRLINGDITIVQHLDLVGVEIHRDDLVTEFGHAANRHQTNISCSHNGEFGHLPRLRAISVFTGRRSTGRSVL